MTEHKRRPGYWQYYEPYRKNDPDFLRRVMLALIMENPHPAEEKRSNRGRKPTHSRAKMDFLCLIKIAKHLSFRDVLDELGHMRDVWDEPKPDCSWVTRHMQKIDPEWLDAILVETGRMCLEELEKSGTGAADGQDKEITIRHESRDLAEPAPGGGGPTAPLGSDSSGVETDRYEYVERPDPKNRDFATIPVKTYYKYHITAITGHQIVLAAYVTPNNVSDTVMFPEMIGFVSKNYPELGGRVINADKGYDSDKNCKAASDAGMIPNIKQREPSEGATRANRGKPNRKKAAEEFDPATYKKRSMIEGIFGAEETRNHQLHCRMRLEENRRRFGKVRAIAWNIRALCRFKSAHEKGHKIPSYA